MKYDFSVLSPEEFEEMVNKLLSQKDVVVEQYRMGRDDGHDGYRVKIPEKAMIQVKHYANYQKLKSGIENEEIKKIKKEQPEAYVLATSFDLTHHQTVELKSKISPYVKEAIVLGYKSICERLDNNPKVLRSMVKLWSLNAELTKHIINPEKMSRFIQLKDRFDKIDKTFVETPDLIKIQETLDNIHIVLISGEPGVGKTTLAEYLCFYYLANDFDVEIFEGDFSREHYDLSDSSKKILYYFDDFLGSNYLNCISDKSDSAIVKFIKTIQKEPNKLFILTSRTNIVNRASEKSQSYRDYGLKNKQYIVDVGKYDALTKAKILRNHLKNSDLELSCIQDVVASKKYNEIIHHRNFNPRLIEFITKKEKFDDCGKNYLDFVRDSLNNPIEIWEHCFNEQLNHFQRLLVRLVAANNGSAEETLLRNAYTRAIQLYSYPIPESECVDYEYVLKICERCILNRTIEIINNPAPYNRAVISVTNPSVSDYVLPTIKNDADLTKLCSALRSLDSIRLVKSLELKDEKKILKSILLSYDKEEWDDAKLELMNSLNIFENLVFFVDAVNQKDFNITPQNRSIIISLISKTINVYNWSDFLDKYINELRDKSLGYEKIYEVYQNSSFCKQNVLDKIKNEVILLLKDNIADDIVDSYDSDCDGELSEDDITQRSVDIFQESIKLDYPWLNDDSLKTIQEGFDANQLAEEINKKAMEERWSSEDDEYYRDTLWSSLREDEEIEQKVDQMFSELLHE